MELYVVKNITRSSYLNKVAEKYLNKIRGKSPLKDGEQVLTAFSYYKQDAHSGQVLQRKILPNGNTRVRTVTVYTGEAHALSIDIKIYSPSSELLKAYHGIRGPEIRYIAKNGKEIMRTNPTRDYANTPEEINKIIKNEMEFNPQLKYNYIPTL